MVSLSEKEERRQGRIYIYLPRKRIRKSVSFVWEERGEEARQADGVCLLPEGKREGGREKEKGREGGREACAPV